MFIPIIPPSAPSPAAQELGGLIAQLVRDYRAENSDTSITDVQQALVVARSELQPEVKTGAHIPLLLALAFGVVTLVGILTFSGSPNAPWIAIMTIGAVLVGLIAVVLWRRSS